MSQAILKIAIPCMLFLLLSVQGNSQVVTDPATGQMDITDQNGVSLNANFIAPAEIVTLKIPVYNLNQLVGLPLGTCKFIISLGNNMVLDPSFNLAAAPLSNYFSWTTAIAAGKLQITGNLISALPQDFDGIAAFKIKATNILGTSMIESDFLVTNHNTTTPLTDEDPNNNTATLTYTVTTQTVPVTFTNLFLTKKGCRVQVNFTTENAINVNRYEIELSKDAIHYIELGEIARKNTINYQYDFTLTDATTAPNIFIRIKSVDQDGSFGYSDTKKLSGICDDKKADLLRIYPNPITDQQSSLVINKGDQGVFNGQYIISLMDLGGKIIEKKLLKLNNVQQINYRPGILSAGTYYIKVQGPEL